MNKQEYLYELERALKASHVRDSADILEEYAEHFDRKLKDGYGEEEIAARLASPKDIAGQFAEIKPAGGAGKGVRAVLATGLGFADIVVGSFFIMLYAWVLALGAFAIVCAGLGFAVAAGIPLWNIIPEMPYYCALFLGTALLALAVLTSMGTEYCRLYTTQLLRVYIRWHRKVMGDSGRPPLTMHPQIGAKKRRIMRNIVLVSLVIFVLCFVVGLGSMMIAAGSIEPWHVWHWFV